jgi:hypothetical protein
VPIGHCVRPASGFMRPFTRREEFVTDEGLLSIAK